MPTNMGTHRRLKHKLGTMPGHAGVPPAAPGAQALPWQGYPLGNIAYQAATCRFGVGPATPVLDLNCRTHEADNLYVTDTSFFPSIGAVNPTLTTIITNGLHVADHLLERTRRARGKKGRAFPSLPLPTVQASCRNL